jgi:hypothetical protein
VPTIHPSTIAASYGIAWPVSADDALISDKDCKHPVLSDLPRFFEYGPTGARAAGLAR